MILRGSSGRGRAVVFGLALSAMASIAVPGHAAGKGQRLTFIQQPSASLAGQPIAPAVVVAVTDHKGQVKTSSTALITLALQSGGTLFGTKTIAAAGGVATFSDLVIDTGGTYRLVATDGSSVSSGTSNAFDVSGFAVNCPSGGCSESTGNIQNPTPADSTIGVVTVSTGECATEACFLTVTEDAGCPPDVQCRGNAVLFVPPANATGITVVDYGCDKSICPGTGVANFHTFKQRADGTWVELTDCPNPEPTVEELGPDGCVESRSRTGVGDLVITVWLPADGDPRIVN